jgi:hypothetical protein
MIVPRQLDIDWLHSTVELLVSGRYRHRREGKTVAYLMLMVGEIELGGHQNNYLYIGQTADFTQRVQDEFVNISKTIVSSTPQYQRNKVSIDAQNFFFYPIDILIQRPGIVKGWTLDRIFMDIDDGTQRKLDKDGRLDALFRTLLPQLSYRRGDVI